jgi:hypothetical protein
MSFRRSHFFPEHIPDIHNILISGVPNNGLLSLVAGEDVFRGLRPGGGFILLSAALYCVYRPMPDHQMTQKLAGVSPRPNRATSVHIQEDVDVGPFTHGPIPSGRTSATSTSSTACLAMCSRASSFCRWINNQTNPDHSSRLAFLPAGSAHARRRSVRLDRCASTRCATHWGLICLVGGSSGHAAPWFRGRTASGQARRRGTALPPGSSSATGRECARYVRSPAPRS